MPHDTRAHTRAPMARHRQTRAHAAMWQTQTLPHTATLKDAVKQSQLGQRLAATGKQKKARRPLLHDDFFKLWDT